VDVEVIARGWATPFLTLFSLATGFCSCAGTLGENSFVRGSRRVPGFGLRVAGGGIPGVLCVETKGAFAMRAPRSIVACTAMLACCVLVGEPFAASPRARLRAESAHARQVLQQVNALDLQFGRAVEAWHGAQYELGKARVQLALDRAMLRFAERQQRIALARVNARLIALYEGSDSPSSIEILFGSSTFSDVVGGLDAVQAISAADHALAVQMSAARARYTAVEKSMRATERSRAAAVVRLGSQRAQIGAMLVRRRQLLSSIQSRIAALQQAEARKQALLAAQARARLAQEQALLREQSSGAGARHRGCGVCLAIRSGVYGAWPSALVGRPDRPVERCDGGGSSGGGNDRAALPRRAICVGWFDTGRLRLLRARDVRLCPARHRVTAFRRRAVRIWRAGSRALSSSPATLSSSTG
jgi:hypothetical protein